MNSLLLVPGRIPYSHVEDLNKDLLIPRLKVVDRYCRYGWERFPGKKFLFDTLSGENKNVDIDKLSTAVDSVFKLATEDLRTLLIVERCLSGKRWYSLFDSIRVIHEKINKLLMLLMAENPAAVIFQATPHGDWEWLLGKAAEFLKIPVYMLSATPLPWRFGIVKGIDSHAIVNTNLEFENVDESEIANEKVLIEQFLRLNTGEYTRAIPEYEKKRFSERAGNVWSWRKELSNVCRDPRNILKLPLKYILYRRYIHYSQNPIKEVPDNIICVFLHFQPERTSLPEGGSWCQQTVIIRSLSNLLPPGWVLWIKEHPSQFMGRFQYGYRSPSFYDSIASLPNVSLVPLQSDTFELIDASKAVVTITGTVGLQALIRRKRVLIFGPASYRNAPGVFQIATHADLRDAIDTITGSELNDSKDALIDVRYFESFLTSSISGRTLDDHNEPLSWYSDEFRLRAHGRILRRILTSEQMLE